LGAAGICSARDASADRREVSKSEAGSIAGVASSHCKTANNRGKRHHVDLHYSFYASKGEKQWT